MCDATGRRQEIVFRILCIDAAFDGVSMPFNIRLTEGEPLAHRNSDLLAHEVNAGDEFGDGMLDLQARVHLKKVELARRVCNEKLNRACARVINRARRSGAIVCPFTIRNPIGLKSASK